MPGLASCARFSSYRRECKTRWAWYRLSIAAGSASETEYQPLLARDLGYLAEPDHRDLDAQVNDVKRMLNAFIQRVT